MTLEHIREFTRGSKPFTLHMVSGRAIDVPHPDFIALAPEGTFIVFVRENGRVETIRINQIKSIEAPADTTGN